jgi:hypothetical protein
MRGSESRFVRTQKVSLSDRFCWVSCPKSRRDAACRLTRGNKVIYLLRLACGCLGATRDPLPQVCLPR